MFELSKIAGLMAVPGVSNVHAPHRPRHPGVATTTCAVRRLSPPEGL